MKLYTPQQIADILQLDIRTVYLMLRSGKIKALKLGRKSWRVREEALEDYLKGLETHV